MFKFSDEELCAKYEKTKEDMTLYPYYQGLVEAYYRELVHRGLAGPFAYKECEGFYID